MPFSLLSIGVLQEDNIYAHSLCYRLQGVYLHLSLKFSFWNGLPKDSLLVRILQCVCHSDVVDFDLVSGAIFGIT